MDICQLNRGASWHTPHMLSCSLAQMIGSLEIYFRVFFHRGTCISDVHTGHTLYQFYGVKWMIFHE